MTSQKSPSFIDGLIDCFELFILLTSIVAIIQKTTPTVCLREANRCDRRALSQGAGKPEAECYQLHSLQHLQDRLCQAFIADKNG
jgi:hypothetical protein